MSVIIIRFMICFSSGALNYSVSYTSLASDVTVTSYTGDTSVKLTGLEQLTYYEVVVHSLGVRGAGQHGSDALIIRTG